jgi:hypothetical protein
MVTVIATAGWGVVQHARWWDQLSVQIEVHAAASHPPAVRVWVCQPATHPGALPPPPRDHIMQTPKASLMSWWSRMACGY